jgi:hypothetical protein
MYFLILDANENKIVLNATTNENLIISINDPQSSNNNNIQETLKRELEKSDECVSEVNENKKVKKNDDDDNSMDSSSSFDSSSSSSIFNQKDNNDIDVENFSDCEETETKTHDNANHDSRSSSSCSSSSSSSSRSSYINENSVNSTSSCKENNNNSTQWSNYQLTSPSKSPSSSLSTSSTPVTSPLIIPKSVSPIETLNPGSKSKIDDDPLKNKQNQLNNNKNKDSSIEIKKQSYNINGKINKEQQQRSAPIVMNGKKYYRKFVFFTFL